MSIHRLIEQTTSGMLLAAFAVFILAGFHPVSAQTPEAQPSASEALPPKLAPDLAELEKLSNTVATAKKAEALAERLRTPLYPYPVATQRMHLARARALANQGKLAEADRYFRDAYAANAPDAEIRLNAINTHAGFLANDPATVDPAVRLTKEVLKTTNSDDKTYQQAAYRLCCLLIVSGKYPDAAIAQSKLASLPKLDPGVKDKVSRLGHYLEALNKRATGIDPYFASWRAMDPFGSIHTQRRIADLAFAMKDIPRAARLYKQLISVASKESQPEIASWSEMQHARTFYLSEKKDYEKAMAGLDRFRTTNSKAACAPYALLQNALLQNNISKDKGKSRRSLETIIRMHPRSPEAEHASYYLAMLSDFRKRL